MTDWCFHRFPEHDQEICRMEVGNIPNDEPAKLTLASSIAAQNQGQPKLLDQVRNTFRMLHNSKRTEEAYVGWIRRYLLFAKVRHGDWIHPTKLDNKIFENFLFGVLHCVAL